MSNSEGLEIMKYCPECRRNTLHVGYPVSVGFITIINPVCNMCGYNHVNAELASGNIAGFLKAIADVTIKWKK